MLTDLIDHVSYTKKVQRVRLNVDQYTRMVESVGRRSQERGRYLLAIWLHEKVN